MGLGFADDFNDFDEGLLKADLPERSHPTFCFVIEIKNNNPIALQNIAIGNASINLEKENFGLPPNITVTCKTIINEVETETTYEDYLKQSKAYPFKVGLIYVGNPMGLIFDPILKAPDFYKKLITMLDPYRQLHTFYRHVLLKEFTVNGEEKIIIDKFPAKQSCVFQLYVSEKIDIK